MTERVTDDEQRRFKPRSGYVTQINTLRPKTKHGPLNIEREYVGIIDLEKAYDIDIYNYYYYYYCVIPAGNTQRYYIAGGS